MLYRIEWMGGEGAASRGETPDSIITQKINCDPDMIGKILYAVKLTFYLYNDIFNTSKTKINDKGLMRKDEELCNYAAGCINDLNNYLDRYNLNGIDGGDPWVIRIDEGSETIYKDDYYGDYYDEIFRNEEDE